MPSADDSEFLCDIQSLPSGANQVIETVVSILFGSMLCYYSFKELIGELTTKAKARRT